MKLEKKEKIARKSIKNFIFVHSALDQLFIKACSSEMLSEFYPDLNDEKLTSRFAVFHQRYSTNTFPSWDLAQPLEL